MTLSTVALVLAILCMVTAFALRGLMRGELALEQARGLAPVKQAGKMRRLLMCGAFMAVALSMGTMRDLALPMAGLMCLAYVFVEGRACQAIDTYVPAGPARILIAMRLAELTGMLLAVGVMTRALQ